MTPVSIAGRPIGPDHPPYVIAELSGNHNGDIKRALALMEMAKAAGADAVKLQTYTADTITIDHDGPEFTIHGGLWDGRTLYDLYCEAHTPWDWHEALFAKGRELGITVFSSPFDDTAVDFLESLGVPAFKIASFEAVDLPLIGKAAATSKPLIISTGMADEAEIADAVAVARSVGGGQLVLLHCVSAYPARPEEANLRSIPELASRFGVAVGLSDHTPGTAVSVAAIALGACVIEKHVTLRRADGGLDAAFSLEPGELQALCDECRTAWSALGQATNRRSAGETGNAVFRRSLYVVEDVKAGEVLTKANIRSIRPGYGLLPKHLPEVLGRRANRDLKRGTALTWDMVE
jgi:N-acetylneuraminate synthase